MRRGDGSVAAERKSGRQWLRGVGLASLGLAGLAGVAVLGGYAWLRASLPVLEGTVAADGLTAPVMVQRDRAGVVTLTGTDRVDVARALGFLHGQERFFQMDLLRRSAAGELAGLFGEAALPADRKRRIHRFRSRAQRLLPGLPAGERSLIEAYVAGVNQGLAALTARPWEYALLGQAPRPWSAEDTLLVTWAMFFDLQDGEALLETARARAVAELGADWTAFLHPMGSSFDAALDASRLPPPPLPTGLPAPAGGRPAEGAAPGPHGRDPDQVPGSNNWAVGGALTAHGGAMLANDMHLGHGVPNLWYRARIVLTGDDGAMETDLVGVTLPGVPNLVVGSNRHIAWGFTNSFIDTGDTVVLQPGSAPGSYRTPTGDLAPVMVEEEICPADGVCETLRVEETIWGPVIATDDQGRRLALRWVAHDMTSGMTGLLGLETAQNLEAAIAIGQHATIPNQNLMLAGRDGRIAWTIAGRIPRRIGHDGSVPASWADGTLGWNGWLTPAEMPLVLAPDSHRLWSANARMVGGQALARLGDGGYDHGARAGRIRDLLFARDSFTEADLLAIQLDDRAMVLDRWQELMRERLEAATDPALAAMLPHVRDWGGRAVPDSVGYRLVRQFREELQALALAAYRGIDDPKSPEVRIVARHTDDSLWRLLTERPVHLVPPGYAGWDGLIDAALAAVLDDVAAQAEGDLRNYSWGARNRPGVRHPLSGALPPIAWLLDPADEPLPGDVYQPRVQGVGFGASQRLVVSPGREEYGVFHMPGGQSGHPLSPYHLAGHDDWRTGHASPLLPGPARWTLTLVPSQP